MRYALSALLLVGCASHPTSWRVELRPGVTSEPAEWQSVMNEAANRATCSLHGKWGGVITVHSAPYLDGYGIKVWGNNPGDHSIGIVYAPRARDTALPEEACHAWLGICESNFYEPPAKACAVAVKASL
jgi:hypothetical protein